MQGIIFRYKLRITGSPRGSSSRRFVITCRRESSSIITGDPANPRVTLLIIAGHYNRKVDERRYNRVYIGRRSARSDAAS